MLVSLSVILLAGTGIAFQVNPLSGVLLLVTALLLAGTAILFTVRRYKDIEKLSGYLRKIYGGDYSLDIRDNTEGELSILKNEIYKVTLILSKQTELLKTEKEQLADALSDISHQLKTPLTSMLVMTDLLNNDALEPGKRKEFTRNLTNQLKRMEWLLTSLLKLSKIDAGTATFKKERINAAELISHAAKPLLIPMELKNQRLLTDGDASLTFSGDYNWTTEAFINILKNCVEHTPDGGTISVHFDENPMYTEIIISDNGIGIDAEDLPYIFKRFYKGKNANEESVGIGLAMAKSIISSQNGDISVSSIKNRGSSFCIKFYKQIV
jgi:signal transduction histidine kinase